VATLDHGRIYRSFGDAVNMDAAELEAWLEIAESRRADWTRPGTSESVGHAAGRAIVRILRTAEPALAPEDYRLMRKAVGFIRRHRAQEPANIATSRWRYSLMNWDHDPLNDLRGRDPPSLPSSRAGCTFRAWPRAPTTAPPIRATPRS
jgi:hypothetical protein